MKCPVCEADFDFPIQSLEEVYYDCPQCHSALLLKNGDCEVLNKGGLDVLADSSEPSHSPKEVSKTEKKEEDLQSLLEEASSLKDSISESSAQETPFEQTTETKKAHSEFLDPLEESSLESPLKAQESEALEEFLEEEFVPDETTRVPELDPVKNDYLEKQEKEEITDFPFEEKKDPSLESQVSVQEKEEKVEALSEELQPPHLQEKVIQEKEEKAEALPEELQSPPLQEKVIQEKEEKVEALSEELQPPPLQEKVIQEKEEKAEALPEELQSPPLQEKVIQEKDNLSDVEKFGNTQNQDKDGLYLYDLVLSEINSQDLREKVLSVLDDEALNLPLYQEEESIKESIKDGQLTIEKISPVKTYIIVTALMGLPLQISWKQHHLAESK